MSDDTRLTTNAPVDLVPLESPVRAYLARLGSESSRRTVRASLDTIARLAVPGATATTFRWWQLRFAQTQVLRERIVAHCPAPATARKHLSVLRGILKVCSRMKGRAPDGSEVRLLPLDDLHDALDFRDPIGVRVSHGHVLTPIERRALVTAAVGAKTPLASIRDSAVVALALETGLRREEFAKLSLQSVAERTIRVVGKRDKERELPLVLAAAPLAAWTDTLRADAQARGLVALPAWPLFCAFCRGGRIVYEGHAPRRLSVTGVSHILRAVAERAGIGHFPTHDWRRNFITAALAEGVGLGEVQNLVGHDSADTTLLYDLSGAEKRRAAMESVASKLRGDP